VRRTDVTLPDEMVLAPFGRRAAAAAIDVSIVVAALGTVGVAVFAPLAAGSKLPHPVAAWFSRLTGRFRSQPEGRPRAPKPERTAATRLARSVPALTVAVTRRNDRSPGAYAMGLRRVSRTGAPPTLRSALIRETTSAALNELSISAIRRGSKRSEDLSQEDNIVIGSSACGWAILCSVLLHVVPIWLSPLRQSIPDRMAGIVVVEEHRRSLGVDS
jgi:uncharacterized RDD family membrane protein YckC